MNNRLGAARAVAVTGMTAAAAVSGTARRHAQPTGDFMPVTDAMVQAGATRQVVTGIPGKTGVAYTLDRPTGEFLWATPTVVQNITSGIDGATGAVTDNAAKVTFTAVSQQVFTSGASRGNCRLMVPVLHRQVPLRIKFHLYLSMPVRPSETNLGRHPRDGAQGTEDRFGQTLGDISA